MLLLAIIIFNLGISSYNIKEGITAKEIRDEVDNKTNANIQKNKPQSEPLPKNFDISISDSKNYEPLDLENSPIIGRGQRIIKKVPRFIELFPNQKYLISSTTNEKINNTTPQSLDLDQSSVVTLLTETSKFNSYIIIAPDSESMFPPEFKISINNRQFENKIQTWLWGFSITKGSTPTNGIINGDNINNMPYNTKLFKIDASGGLAVAGINIGNNAIQAVEVNPILNKL